MGKIGKNLGNFLRTGVFYIATALIPACTSCVKENFPPTAKIEVSPLTGEVPLNVRANMTKTTDVDGIKDITKYILYKKFDGNTQKIERKYALDTIFTLSESGIYEFWGEAIDSRRQSDKTAPVRVEVYGKPFIEQSVSLQNDVNIKYDATLYRVPLAELTITRNGEHFANERVMDINSTGTDFSKTYNYTSDGITKGNYEYTLKAGDLEKKTSVSVPNYLPTASSIAPLNFLEETDTTITLPKPTDKNPEDVSNINWTEAISLDGKTTPTLIYEGENTKLKLKGNKNQTGAYQVKLKFGSAEGGLEEKILTGEIAKDTRIKVDPFSATNENGVAYDLLTTKAERDAYVQAKLYEDWTNTIPYNPDPVWDCTEYSKQLKRNFHGFPGISGYSGFDLDSIYYYHGTLKDNGKYGLPVYPVIVNFDDHEMNAILTGDNAELFSDWSFIEPQFDMINVQPGQAYIPMNCVLTIKYTYVNKSQSQGNYLASVPILKFQITNGIPSLIWKTSDSNLKFITQREK